MGKKAEKETLLDSIVDGGKKKERYGEVPFRIKLYAERERAGDLGYVSRKPH